MTKLNKIELMNKRYDRMIELEKLRHNNIMLELQFMKDNKIKVFERGRKFVDMYKR